MWSSCTHYDQTDVIIRKHAVGSWIMPSTTTDTKSRPTPTLLTHFFTLLILYGYSFCDFLVQQNYIHMDHIPGLSWLQNKCIVSNIHFKTLLILLENPDKSWRRPLTNVAAELWKILLRTLTFLQILMQTLDKSSFRPLTNLVADPW